MKEESAKAGLHANIKKTKLMTTGGIYNFNVDNEDAEIATKDFAYLDSLINSNGDCSQEMKSSLRPGRTAMEELGKIMKSKGVSLENEAKIIHTLAFPITMYRCSGWTVKKADREKLIH